MQDRLKREHCVEMCVQKESVYEGWSRESSRSVLDPKPVLLSLGHTWNDLGWLYKY